MMLPTNADRRTARQMQQAAAYAIAQFDATSASRGQATMPSAQLTTLAARDHLSVLATVDGTFAIVSHDPAQPAVLGVGHTDSDGHNPEFDWYLEVADAALATGRPLRRIVPDVSKYPARVDNLLWTTWSQDEPYKNQTPLMPNGDNYVTGCVATSMAQVLAYHRLPLRGQGEASVTAPTGQVLTANFGRTLYDWEHMNPSYNHIEKNYTDREAEAVATLMAHCGVACRMAYNETGSGASNDDAADGLRRYFGFTEARNVRRASYGDEQWMNLIFDELAHRSPIMFGAQSSYGHSFVFSGYREDGLVYVNWGWGGDKNGFFDVSVLDPDQNGGFVTNQQMIIGVRSYQPDVWEESVVTTAAGTLASMLNPALTYGQLTISGPLNETDLEHLRQRICSARTTTYPNAADTYALDLSGASFADDRLPDGAFADCAGLRRLVLPASLRELGVGVFAGCTALTRLTVPAQATADADFAVDGGIVYATNRTHVRAVMADARDELRLPEGVSHIDDQAFSQLWAVTKIDLPSSLTNLGRNVFASGTQLEQLWMRPSTRPTLADRNVFSSITAQTFLYVHAANKSVYRTSPYSQFAGTRLFGTLIKAISTVREYGQENPEFKYTAEGDPFTGEPELYCEATPLSAPGTYPIYCRQGTVEGDDIVCQDGALTIIESQGINDNVVIKGLDSHKRYDLGGRRHIDSHSPKTVIIAGGRKVVE